MTSAPGPWKARSSAGVVAPATKVRPYSPSVSHGTSDAGLPDTDAVVGATTPGAVVVSYCRKRSLTQSKNPSRTTADQVALLVLPPGPEREAGGHHHDGDGDGAYHARRRTRRLGSRPTRRSTAPMPAPARVPSRYPMAADSPLTAPWEVQVRGSMLGSRDHHQKSSATAAPPNVGRRNSQPRCRLPRSRPVSSRRRTVSWATSTSGCTRRSTVPLALVASILALAGHPATGTTTPTGATAGDLRPGMGGGPRRPSDEPVRWSSAVRSARSRAGGHCRGAGPVWC